MQLIKWFETNNVSIYSQDKIKHLLKVSPYTEEEIMKAVEISFSTAKLMGLDIDRTINMIYIGEIGKFK